MHDGLELAADVLGVERVNLFDARIVLFECLHEPHVELLADKGYKLDALTRQLILEDANIADAAILVGQVTTDKLAMDGAPVRLIRSSLLLLLIRAMRVHLTNVHAARELLLVELLLQILLRYGRVMLRQVLASSHIDLLLHPGGRSHHALRALTLLRHN